MDPNTTQKSDNYNCHNCGHKHNFHRGGGVASVIIFFGLLYAFAKWGPAINFSTTTQDKGQPMIVSGDGKATAIPDIARVDAGIQSSGGSLSQVQSEVDKKSQTLVSALKNLGIDDKDIKTAAYNIYPQQDYQANPPTITGYQISVNYEVTIRKIDTINNVMTTLTSNGANLIGSVNFDLSDKAKLKATNNARIDAVAQAKTNAQSLADAAGVALGKVINVTENDGSNIRPVPLMATGGGIEKSTTQPNIQPGTTEIDVTVVLSYEIR